MPYYAHLNDAGMVVAVTQASEVLEGPHIIAIETYDATLIGALHNAQTGAFSAPPASDLVRTVSVLAFRRRFTKAERAAIEWAAVDRSDQPVAIRQQAAALRATLADQAAANFIDLNDNDTAVGVQGLETMGLLAPGRAAEIITTPVRPEELP